MVSFLWLNQNIRLTPTDAKAKSKLGYTAPRRTCAWHVCATVTLRGELPMKRETPALPNGFRVTRRNFVRIASAASAVVLARITTEADLAFAQRVRPLTNVPPDAILINANENPLGPCVQACSAMADLAS